MNGLRLFIDNSNLFIEAQRTAREYFHYDDQMIPRLRISYGNLLDIVRQGVDLSEAVLVGSRPPQNDSLWDKLRELKIEPQINDRSPWTGKEKKVDASLMMAIAKAIYKNKPPGTIALVAGDSDYVPAINDCLEEGWKVKLYFWQNISHELQQIEGVEFCDLGDNFEHITFLESSRL